MLTRLIAITVIACSSPWLAVAGESPSHGDQIARDAPVAHWSFDEPTEETKHLEIDKGGKIGWIDGPRPTEYPQFSQDNRALRLDGGARLEISDEGDESRYDFDNGDEISVEAMVNPRRLNDQAVILAKGRTHNDGFARDNQNWSFRLKSVAGRAGVNFLFRSRDGESTTGDWHRWTTTEGFGVNTGWHHVAITYRFGEPDSIRAYIDGVQVSGKWDMGGPTSAPPVVDNDEIWIGSAMAGNLGNSFFGSLDEIALHRRIIPPETFATRFHRVTLPPVIPTPVAGVLQIQMHGPFEDNASFPNDPGDPIASWQQDAMGFVRIPNKYDDWGVRDDWGTGVMVRAVTEIDLDPGTYEFLARSRGIARLFIDREVLLEIPRQKRGGGAHNKVQPVPDVPRPGMRPHAMDDVERIASFVSPGGKHEVVLDIMLGGPRLRLEFGEACLAIAKDGGMFRLVGPTPGPELSDRGWTNFADALAATLDGIDVETRRAADKQQSYWQYRHRLAAQRLTGEDHGETIDTLVQNRIDRARQESGDRDSFFNREVRPIFSEHCYRCHGDKDKGDLNLLSIENLFEGGESGYPAVVPGSPDESYLIQLVSAQAGEGMPPQGPGLTPAQIETLTEWVSQGGQIEPPPLDVRGVTPIVEDLVFLRRVWIDTVGVAPPLDVVREFREDDSPDKRLRMVDRLLQDDRWADNWMGYWQDALAENPNLLKPMLNNTGPFRYWILEALRDNKPMDRFATELIMMRGSKWGGGAGGFAIATQNDVPMAAKAHIIGTAFLGVDMKCARCHDAPYHETTQQELFQLAAMLSRQEIEVPETSSVPAEFFDHVSKGGRESLIDVTLDIGSRVTPVWPFDQWRTEIPDGVIQNTGDTRERIAAEVTFSRRFAEVMVNRFWKRLMGAGLVEPVDDWEGHAPSDPKLLAYLTDEFIRSGYDIKQLARLIMTSNVYQRHAIDVPENLVDAERYFEGPYRRRMTAEQVVDNAWHVAGQEMNVGHLTMDIEGRLAPDFFMNFGQPRRAWEFTTLANERDRPSLAMPRIQAVVDVLRAFGWRNSRQEPTSHRIEEPNPRQPGVLANGVMGSWLTRLSDDSDVTRMCLDADSARALVDDLFLRFLTRLPTEEERSRFVALLEPGFDGRVVPEHEVGPEPQIERIPHVSWSNHLDGEANSIKQRQEEAARRGDPPTRFLTAVWREQAEDALWALFNAPEMIMIP